MDRIIKLELEEDTAIAVLLGLEHYKMSAVSELDSAKRQQLVNEFRAAVNTQLFSVEVLP